MNSSRKKHTFFLIIIFGLCTIHAHAMHHTSTFNNKDVAILAAGCAIGIGCAGLYFWHKTDKHLEKLEKDNQQLRNTLQNIKLTQEQETVRLNQTRGWVIENREEIKSMQTPYQSLRSSTSSSTED